MISVLILTYNEAANIRACIDSVAWSDDIVVIDSFSEDDTVRIAQSMGAHVVLRAFTSFASQRNFGTNECGLRHPWVLHLDADEVVSRELAQELSMLAHAGTASAYRVPSKLMFRGVWLRHSGLYPSYQVRFGRADRLRFVQVGHGQREALPAAEVGTVSSPLIHNNFSKGLFDWFAKHNRYSSDEARESLKLLGKPIDWRGLVAVRDPARRRRALKHLSIHVPLRGPARFVYMYVIRRGFLDGRAGFTYAVMMSMYEQMTVLKVRELAETTAGRT